LRRTNIYDDAFHISYDGHFGTINGFRLGRLPSQHVDWYETNAALGQVVLLVQTIGKQMGFEFKSSKPVPCGSFSYMIDEKRQKHQLYGSNEFSLQKIFWSRHFDTALVMLLSCIKELGSHASAQDPDFGERWKRSYHIGDDKIGPPLVSRDGGPQVKSKDSVPLSVKLQLQDGNWTQAMKYLLSNLKVLLVWMAKQR
jgi:beclin 1